MTPYLVAIPDGQMHKAVVHKKQKVIAIGPKGGKIVGYDSKHKPIYAADDDDGYASDPTPSDAESGAESLGAAVLNALKSLFGIQWGTDAVEVKPHPQIKGGYVATGPDVYEDTVGEKGGAIFSEGSVKIKAMRSKGKSVFLLMDKAPPVPKHDGLVAAHVEQGEVPDQLPSKSKYKKQQNVTYGYDAFAAKFGPVDDAKGDSLDVSKIAQILQDSPHRWHISHYANGEFATTKPVKLNKWATTGVHAPKGIEGLTPPGTWESLGWKAEKMTWDDGSVGFLLIDPSTNQEYWFKPMDQKKKWSITADELSSIENGPSSVVGHTPDTEATELPSVTDLIDSMIESELLAESKVDALQDEEHQPVSYDVVQEFDGVHGAYHLSSSTGDNVVWKKWDKFAAPAEIAGSALASHITGGFVPKATEFEWQGNSGIAAPYATLNKNTKKAQGFDPAELNEDQAAQLFSHMISDWVVSNWDSHSGNFGIDEKGNVIGIDKGQAFKFFKSPEVSSKTSGQWSEPSELTAQKAWPPLGSNVSVYPAFAEAVKSGKVKLDVNHPAIKSAILRCQKMTKSMVKSTCGGYAKVAFKGKTEAFYNAVLDRAHNISGSIESVLSDFGVASGSLQDGASSTYEGMDVVSSPQELPTKVSLGGQSYNGSYKVNDTRDQYINSKFEMDGVEYTVIGREKLEVNAEYESPYSSKFNYAGYVCKSDSGYHVVGFNELLAAEAIGNLTMASGNPIYQDMPEGAVVVKAGDDTKAIMDEILDTKHKGSTTYRDVINGYIGNNAGVLIAGGLTRDALQGVKGLDVDLATTAGFQANYDIANALNIQDKYGSVHQALLKVKDSNDGIDITSFRGPGFNQGTSKVSTSSKKVVGTVRADSISLSEDAKHRDWSMNAIFYDPENDTIIDCSGRGISDAKDKKLHPPTNDIDGWLDANGARSIARGFKFMARGYTMSPKTKALMLEHFGGQANSAKQLSDVMYTVSKKLKGKSAQAKKQRKTLHKYLTKEFGASHKITKSVMGAWDSWMPGSA